MSSFTLLSRVLLRHTNNNKTGFLGTRRLCYSSSSIITKGPPPHYRGSLIQHPFFHSHLYFGSKTHTKINSTKSENNPNNAHLQQQQQQSEPKEAAAELKSELQPSSHQHDSSSGNAEWKVKWFKFRRMFKWFAILFGIPLCIQILHDKGTPYKYTFQLLRNRDPSKKPPTWAVYLCMFWGSFLCSWQRLVYIYIYICIFFINFLKILVFVLHL